MPDNILPRHERVLNAQQFILEYQDKKSEEEHAKTFWNDFFKIFGLRRSDYANFEYAAPRASNVSGWGKADLFWHKHLLVEHKSASKDSDSDWVTTFEQAQEYFDGVVRQDAVNNTEYAPQYIVLCNFKRFRIYKIQKNKIVPQCVEVFLHELDTKIDSFDFFIKMTEAMKLYEIDVNMQAAKKIGFLHHFLKEKKYTGRKLELLLTRLLFCFFSEDAGLFNIKQFENLALTQEKNFFDTLYRLFIILNTPFDKRNELAELNEIKENQTLYNTLNDFPYVNGNLFEEHVRDYPFKFSMGIQHLILDAARLNWFVISPAIFGTLFQSVMTEDDRRAKGAHYTSQENILRALNPLFLDALYHEFDSIVSIGYAENNRKKRNENLIDLHQRLCKLTLLDPACGCGNFLIVAYNQLRVLEQRIFEHLIENIAENKRTAYFDTLPRVSIHNFYGIEYDEAAAHIGRLALLLTKHQADCRLYKTTKADYIALPLERMPPIAYKNAVSTNWNTLGVTFDYIVGNPPFVGKQLQNEEQKRDMEKITKGIEGNRILDYVTAWYLKAAAYMQKHPTTETVFVSTNSVSQGEQVGVLWKELFTKYKIHINFAHQTFKWSNEDDGIAAVHCVIIGFANFGKTKKIIFDYPDITKPPIPRSVRNVNPYLIESDNNWVEARKKPLCNVPEMGYGSKPTDGGHLLLTPAEKDDLVQHEPKAAAYIRRILGSDEFINGIERYCLWLVDIDPAELQKMPLVKKRVEAVRKMRLSSKKAATVKLADFPTTFAEMRQPTTDYLLIPRVSSENRKYVPIGYISKDIIVNDAVFTLQSTDIFIFGILVSKMHNIWMAHVCGRLKSDFRYSNTIVYNNYAFPMNATAAQRKKVTVCAQTILDVRKKYSNANYAALYSRITMPPDLVKAHLALDKAVDACYRKEAFGSDTERIEFLFAAYQALL